MIVDAEGLVVTYGRGPFRRGFRALDGLDLQVGEGDFFALLGQNGAGKSSALYCLLGLLRPSSGRVTVMGQTPRPGHPMFRAIAYLPEEPHYHPYLSVEEALTYYGRLSGRNVSAAAVDSMLDRLGLAEHRRLRVGRCSKGMKQKVGIAQCLLHEPSLLILDEPMRGLDPAAVHVFRDLLVDMNRRGMTVIMSSHLLSEVELVASRVAIMHGGRMVANDDMSRLRSQDGAVYSVLLKGTAELPPQCSSGSVAGDEVRGTVPADRFHDLMAHARTNQIQVISCHVERPSLEDTYLAILARQGHDA